jgi:hypothetical protein
MDLDAPELQKFLGILSTKKKRDPANPDGMAGYCIKWDSEYHEKLYII